MTGKPILCLDFDGVIHSYDYGWQDGSIYGDLTPGFAEWALAASKPFTLMIHTSRSREQVEAWLKPRELDWLPVTHEKPPAFLTIDDRALTFEGDWGAFDAADLLKFKPWNMRKT